MKNVLSLILALILCLSLCACDGDGDKSGATSDDSYNNSDYSSDTSDTTPTVENLAGNYTSRLWFLNHAITLNSNSTYSFGTTEKGTFKLNGVSVELNAKEGNLTRRFVAGKNCIYALESWRFEKDEEYGLAFSPDENGMADQTFQACILNTNMPGSSYNWVSLDLDTDGSFTLKLGNRGTTGLDVGQTYQGSYTSDESTLTLIYNGQKYPLILNNAKTIFFMIYEKT